MFPLRTECKALGRPAGSSIMELLGANNELVYEYFLRISLILKDFYNNWRCLKKSHNFLYIFIYK